MLMPLSIDNVKSLSITYELRGEALHSLQEFTRSSLSMTGLNRLECMLTDSLCKAFPGERNALRSCYKQLRCYHNCIRSKVACGSMWVDHRPGN